jgi:hypothetical protein
MKLAKYIKIRIIGLRYKTWNKLEIKINSAENVEKYEKFFKRQCYLLSLKILNYFFDYQEIFFINSNY